MRRTVNHDKCDGLTGTLFPPTGDWSCPKSFPDLSSARVIGLDIESKDPKLKEDGPGFIRGDAQVAGVSVSDGLRSWYFPVRHLGGGNHPHPESVFKWLRDTLKPKDRPICGANLQYELEGLHSEGVELNGPLIDVQVAEALIDEESPTGYSLEALCKKYGLEGKDEALLKMAADAYGFTNVKANLWKLPAKYVGPYAEFDALAPIKIFEEQSKIIAKDDLQKIFELESKILPILWQMRRIGIPIDVEAANVLSLDLKKREDAIRSSFFKERGYHIDEWSGPMLAKLFTSLGLHFPTTAKGNASFEGDFLEAHTNPTVRLISEIRDLNRMRETFVNGAIIGNLVKGRLHPQWKQLASDDGGTRTGRGACANPNAQQFPAGKFRATGKPNPIGIAIRKLFISDTGIWAKYDYKQQEPRILTHFANLCDFTGAKLAAMAYRTNKEMDFYQFLVDIAHIDRRPAKDMYLGRCYGMGVKKLAVKLNKTREEAQRILNEFDEKIPFVKEIAESCDRKAQRTGSIRTLLGRRRHFNMWEPVDRFKRAEAGEYVVPKTRAEAERIWPGVRLVRADTRKALNSLIQGSAADMLKAAMLAVHENEKIVPYMMVHDEIDVGVKDEAQAKRVQGLFENAVQMTVPVFCDLDIGRSWK